MTEFIEFKQLLNYEIFVPFLILIVQLIKDPIDSITTKVFKTTFRTINLVFILCFVLRILILGLDGVLINGQMLITTFANSVFISTSGIGLYEVLKKGKKVITRKDSNNTDT